MPDREKVMSCLEGFAEPDWRECYSDSEVQETARQALDLIDELLKVYKEKIELESEKTTLIDEALEVGRRVLRRGIWIYQPGFDKQWFRVSMTIKEAEKIFGTLRQMKDKQT